ncbi:alpha/beta fold hydrolase [Sphingorhabdus sp. Alg231-15]|uniref:alpha/beta fold hydrolase n=1 Tax=Sphingorhabdus sp. Alg231-15 TaxID=1922222 RepID=UPI000D55A138
MLPISNRSALTAFTVIALSTTGACTQQTENSSSERTNVKTVSNVTNAIEKVDGLDIFYRAAGDPSKPALVLLHGFPTSSFMYRKLLAELGEDYYVIAPDYPGFGNSSSPSTGDHNYTFDNLADTMNNFLIQRGIDEYALMIHDYGAPIGFRIALRHPEKITGIIAMNGNAYEEGMSKNGWSLIRQYWRGKTPELEKTIADNVFTEAGMKWQYTHGTRDPESIDPANWQQDYAKISREGQTAVQLALFYDYQNNVKSYPAWQEYLRKNQPPMLIIWGKNDAFFSVAGAEAYKRDVKNIDYNILDTGHFPLEEESDFIVPKVRDFMLKVTR